MLGQNGLDDTIPFEFCPLLLLLLLCMVLPALCNTKCKAWHLVPLSTPLPLRTAE